MNVETDLFYPHLFSQVKDGGFSLVLWPCCKNKAIAFFSALCFPTQEHLESSI